MNKLFYILIIVLTPTLLLGQNISVNADGAAPDNSAILDVSDTTRGILIPRMTFSQRINIASPANGLMVYQTDGSLGFYVFSSIDGTWSRITSEANLNLKQVLALGKDAASDTIYNLNALGIGTSEPSAQVHIHGASTATSILQTTSGAPHNINYEQQTHNITAMRLNTNVVSGGATTVTLSSYNQTTGLQARMAFDNSDNTMFYTNSGTERMRIESGGNIGIGTNSPDSTLDVNGGARVSSMHIENELNTTNTGAFNMIPIAMLGVNASGSLVASTGNVVVAKQGTGIYNVTISGHTADINTALVSATLIANNGEISVFSASGAYQVSTRNSSGVLADKNFNLIIYSP